MLEGVFSVFEDSTARAPTGADAPGPVGVTVSGEAHGVVLPFELPLQFRVCREVPQ